MPKWAHFSPLQIQKAGKSDFGEKIMLSKIARIALLVLLVSPLGWLAWQKSEAGGMKQPDFKTVIQDNSPQAALIAVPHEDTNYRYSILQPAAPVPAFEQAGFNDATFTTGQAGFGTVGSCTPPFTIRTSWAANTRLLLRKTFTVPATATNMRVYLSVDNDVERVWLNGTLIASNITNNNCPTADEFVVNVPQSALSASGNNLLAVQVLDRGQGSYFDAQVNVTVPDPPTPPPCAPTPVGLVSWYRGEGNTLDTAGRHHGYPTNLIYETGKVGQAFSFDGVGNVMVPTNANHNLTNLTIAAWINPTLYDDGYTRVFSKAESYEINILNDGRIAYYLPGVTGLPGDAGSGRFLGGANIPRNQWTHIALTFDGTVARSYTNGVMRREITGLGGAVATNLNSLMIGSAQGVIGTAQYDGLIDEVQIFNLALSGSDIASIVAADSGGSCVPAPTPTPSCVTPPANLVSWWKGEGNFDDVQSRNLGYGSNNVTFAPGRVGQAFSFDGGGEITVPSNLALSQNTFTTGAWVYPTLYDGNLTRVLTRSGSYEIAIRNDGVLFFSLPGISGISGWELGGFSIPLNQWTHIALSYDGSRVRTFINGRIARTIVGVTGTVPGTIEPFVIGSLSGLTGGEKFDGLIDEVIYFNRALSEGELRTIIDSGNSGMCAPPSLQPPVCTPPSNNLVSWYRGENNTNDSTGSNNGSPLGVVTYAPGKVGAAFNFSNALGRVSIPNNASLQSPNFTVGGWIFPTQNDTNYVIRKTGSYEITLAGNLVFIAINGVSGLPDDDPSFGGVRTDGARGIPLNRWTHIALTFDGTRSRFFVNGRVSRNMPGLSGAVSASTSNLFIGSDGNSGPSNFDGLMDEVVYFSRALTETEMRLMVDADSAGMCGSGVSPSIPSLTVSNATVTEGNSGTVNANLVVRLSSPSSQTVAVSYETTDITARAGTDYQTYSGTVTFAPGETNKGVTVRAIGDSVFEPHETFAVSLSNPVNAAIADGQGAITILNDDFAAFGELTFGGANLNTNHPTAFTANEADGFATIQVNRSGDLVGTSTVEVLTNDNPNFVDCGAANSQANARCDYTTSAATAIFAPGETTTTVTIPIINDAYVEGPETVTIALANSTGTHIGPQPTATLTIVDNDSGTPNNNPIDAAQFFVREHYYDFLNRLPDQAGMDYWTGQITQCGADINCINARRLGVSAAFFVELEFQESGAYVYRLYRAAYGNNQPFPNPDTNPPGGSVTASQIPAYAKFLPDRARVVGGASLEEGKLDFANQFAQRAEFVARYPASQTPAQFVDAMLATVQTASGVTFTASERQEFINDVTTDGRGAMLKRLGDNAALRQAEYNRAFVLTQYFGYLRRDPDMAGLNFWLGVINDQPQNIRGMVCAFLTSTEYQQRFSSVVTRGNNLCDGMP
jgi:hypothetical protein